MDEVKPVEELSIEELAAEVRALRADREGLLSDVALAHRRADALALETRAHHESLSSLAHELRTPLNAILGWAQMISAGDVDSETLRRAVASIERNARLQCRMIDELLDLSRIGSGRLKIDSRPFDLVAAVTAGVEGARGSTSERGVELESRIEPILELMIGDPERIQQVVGYLLNYALLTTPRGGKVELRLERRGAGVAIIVEDTGRGLEPALLPRLFDPAQDIGAARTGLRRGLTLAHYLVEQHGGSITAESEGVGRGTRFSVWLPLIARPATAGDTLEDQPRLDAMGKALVGIDILVVDDEPDAREVIQTMLRQAGASVRVAASVLEAMELIGAKAPDVLVSDIAMPVHDGHDLIQRVRRLPPERGGKLVGLAVTAFSSKADRARALAVGFDDHLAKPIDAVALVRAVVKLLASPR